MIREIFLQDLSLWSCVWQSTLLVMIGLVGSWVCSSNCVNGLNDSN